jgi:hypothetical protein
MKHDSNSFPRRAITACLLGTAVFLSGCANVELACQRPEAEWSSELLYFGTTTPTGAVSKEDWAGFLDAVVTPRFPDGFSVWKAAGQWKSAQGSLTKEQSYVLNIAHPNGPQAEKALKEIIEEYKSRFHQESVLRSHSNTCVSF